MADAYLLENGTDRYLLEDGSGVLDIESPYVAKVIALGAVAHYRAGEAGSNIRDAVGANHSTIIGGSPTYGAASLLANETDNTAITLNGTDQYFSIPDVNILDFGDVATYVVWVKMLTRTGNVALIDKGANSIQLAWDGTNKRFRMNVNNLGGDVAFSSLATDDANTHMVAIGKSGTTRKVWVDGVDRTTTGTNQTASSTATALNIGRNANNSEFTNMTWDEASLFPTLLTDADIAALFALGTASPVTVTPAAAALVLATLVPVVTTTANQSVAPGVASLTVASLVPVIGLGLVPGTASLSLATFVPSIAVSNNKLAIPAAATLTLGAIAPTVTASNHQVVAPAQASLTITRLTATIAVSDHKVVAPTAASLAIAALTPTVTASAHQLVTPATVSLAIVTFTPTVTGGAGQTVTPGVATLVITRLVPTVTTTAHQTVVPATASLSLTTAAPTVTASANRVVIPGMVTLVLTGVAPTVTGSVVDYRGTVGAVATAQGSAGAMAVLRDTVVIAYGPGASAGAGTAGTGSVGAVVSGVRDSVGASRG